MVKVISDHHVFPCTFCFNPIGLKESNNNPAYVYYKQGHPDFKADIHRQEDVICSVLCQHIFHSNCTKKYQGNKCPVCRVTPFRTVSFKNFAKHYENLVEGKISRLPYPASPNRQKRLMCKVAFLSLFALFLFFVYWDAKNKQQLLSSPKGPLKPVSQSQKVV